MKKCLFLLILSFCSMQSMEMDTRPWISNWKFKRKLEPAVYGLTEDKVNDILHNGSYNYQGRRIEFSKQEPGSGAKVYFTISSEPDKDGRHKIYNIWTKKVEKKGTQPPQKEFFYSSVAFSWLKKCGIDDATVQKILQGHPYESHRYPTVVFYEGSLPTEEGLRVIVWKNPIKDRFKILLLYKL